MKIFFFLLPFFYLSILLFQVDLSMLEDLGRHLKMGEVIWQCKCVPQTNLFSYTHPDFPVVNHEWLSQLIFYLLYKHFGQQSLLIIKMIIFLFTFTIVFFLAKRESSFFWTSIIGILCITIFSTRFRVRPEMFSYLFIALYMLILSAIQKKKSNYPKIIPESKKNIWKRLHLDKKFLILFLPLLMIIWVNMHIYFIFGAMMYITFLSERFLAKRKADSNLNFWQSDEKSLVLVGIFILAATAINPQFIKGALLPFTIFSNYGTSVEENMSIFEFGNYASTFIYTLALQVFVFEILFVLFLILFAFCFRNEKFSENINAIATGIVGLMLVRSISLFGIYGLRPLARQLTYLETTIRKKMDVYFVNTIKAIIFISVAVAAIMHVKGLDNYHLLKFGFYPYAEDAVEFIKRNNIKGPLFNNYHVGNYLIFGLYPKEKVFIDARPEMYPASFLREYNRMLTDQNFFNQMAEKYQINLIVLGVQLEDPLTIRPFILRQLESKKWIPIHADGNVTILIKNEPKNAGIIKRFALRYNSK